MPRLWLSFVMLSAGLALMVTAQLAGAAPERRGGIFKVGTVSGSAEIDPQVAISATSWWMQYATAAKLYNYRPGGKLVPEVASRFTVSNNGKRYTFFIRKGFRFSDGVPVTALHFEYAINRAATKDLASRAAQFIIDPRGTEIVGAKDVNEGRASRVRGVRVRGNRLIIDLVRPDASFLSKLTMPFFQATSTKLPLEHEVVTLGSLADLPSAGPYRFTRHEVNRVTHLRRNPYWKPGPGRPAPRNLDGVDVNWNLTEQTAFEQVQRGELDQGPVPRGEIANVVSRYGLNRARFWVQAGPCVNFIAFNNDSALLRDNPELRKAINWALDRTDYAGAAPYWLAAPYLTTPWTHILPPGILGSITKPSLQPYSTRANIEKARQLAAGHFRDGKITVYFRSSGTINQAQIVRRDLVNLGFEPANITMRGLDAWHWFFNIYTRDRAYDLAVSVGSCLEYSDPVGSFIPYGASSGLFFPDSPTYRDKIARAKPAELAKLDLDVMRNLAPFAVMNTYNDQYFFSRRVDPRSLSFHRVYTGWSIPAVALK